MSCPRVQYRRRMHYATRGNRMKMVRTPGNKLVMQKRTKRSQGVHTPWVLGHKRLGGTKALRHIDARLASRHEKSVSRAYGGVLSHAQVRDRVVRAFLVEEQRIVKQALKEHAKLKRSNKRTINKRKSKQSKKEAIVKKISAKTVSKKKVPAKKAATARAPIGSKLVKK
ncbi:putative 60S ribosomal protein L34 [Leptomonas pyrrhocoris]|uniref:Putative 60S ribosomal protein L34 n=1 Tax=Leptomonas pyrrhocoris TaxID=157538 RepID=A0A0M9G3G7_LEPPY|nr:putative 60S ribosomal protein L34 [Leptomonas pyrrhocoris]XP_015659828.1 putative 60S ribosomal protein L34 [Leptomonas pyrrhocoris]KPA78629.1 putative 60S ribosomal protein L34 [Leptomonas pyrrhocoris]KPA81389.1 putative 60S ribosomal protein L34 [Leptomonas pyrrhocoris]|eukprot:XP_015657068.1 putative 60S ribosomal protein L34 [Leptomonas pyrrhocoris]